MSGNSYPEQVRGKGSGVKDSRFFASVAPNPLPFTSHSFHDGLLDSHRAFDRSGYAPQGSLFRGAVFVDRFLKRFLGRRVVRLPG
jgi:hypothetical protein